MEFLTGVDDAVNVTPSLGPLGLAFARTDRSEFVITDGIAAPHWPHGRRRPLALISRPDAKDQLH